MCVYIGFFKRIAANQWLHHLEYEISKAAVTGEKSWRTTFDAVKDQVWKWFILFLFTFFLARTNYMAPPKAKWEEGGKISSTCLLRDNDYTALPLTERERASHTPKLLDRDMDCWVITLQSLNSARLMKLSLPFSRGRFYYPGPFSLDYFSNVY